MGCDAALDRESDHLHRDDGQIFSISMVEFNRVFSPDFSMWKDGSESDESIPLLLKAVGQVTDFSAALKATDNQRDSINIICQRPINNALKNLFHIKS